MSVSQNAMHPVQTAMEKDLCLVTPAQPQMFLVLLVCARPTAPLDTMRMKTKCVKVSTPARLYTSTYLLYCSYCKLYYAYCTIMLSLPLSLSHRVWPSVSELWPGRSVYVLQRPSQGPAVRRVSVWELCPAVLPQHHHTHLQGWDFRHITWDRNRNRKRMFLEVSWWLLMGACSEIKCV